MLKSKSYNIRTYLRTRFLKPTFYMFRLNTVFAKGEYMDYLRASKLGLNYMVRPRELEKMVSQLEFGFVLFKHLKQNIESFPFFLKL